MEKRRLSRIPAIVLLVTTLGAGSLVATTFISVEPIPSEQVVGEATLATIQSAGFANLELWSSRLLNECRIVQDVIDELSEDELITTVTGTNTSVGVAAGGFEGVTNPAYVFKMRDSGPGAVSEADVTVLSNALGYVLNQGGTAHFSPDNFKAYDFALDYAVVTFAGMLTGLQAKAFFEHVGTVDPALFSGTFAGFTQIAFESSPTNNSMLFLKPATSKNQFIAGLSTAAGSFSGATYVTTKNNGAPTTARAGISFPENDWISFPAGDQYLARLGNAPAQLLADLAKLRDNHLEAVASLVAAIQNGTLQQYLTSGFACPGQ
jgi:hypothetical protein